MYYLIEYHDDCLVNNWLSAMCDEDFHVTCFGGTYLVDKHNR